jgi:hypothetical protein
MTGRHFQGLPSSALNNSSEMIGRRAHTAYPFAHFLEAVSPGYGDDHHEPAGFKIGIDAIARLLLDSSKLRLLSQASLKG